MINSFMLVLTIWTNDGTARDDYALSFGLSWNDCREISLEIMGQLSADAYIYCELEGVNQVWCTNGTLYRSTFY
jgi:hypothetical protein